MKNWKEEMDICNGNFYKWVEILNIYRNEGNSDMVEKIVRMLIKNYLYAKCKGII